MLAREANVAGWWHSYTDVLPSWFPTYVGLEGAAALIRAYEVQFVHGLFQTEAYARAVTQLGYKAAKYVRRIELVERFDAIGQGKGGYWEDRGYEWWAGI